MEGFLLIDKPQGLTSHDVVDRVRRLTGEKRVGHAGTLDPFATGLLIVGVGRVATREMEKLVGLDKVYEAEFVLGGRSDTDDRTGNITRLVRQSPLRPPFERGERATGTSSSPTLPLPKGEMEGDRRSLEIALQTFVGTIEQIPPAYSAIKIGGKKMYEAAREGKPLEAKARTVTIHALEISGLKVEPGSAGLRFAQDDTTVVVRIACSTGTYIRAIARDLGERLSVGGYVGELRRENVGPFSITEAKTLETLNEVGVETALISVEDLLKRL